MDENSIPASQSSMIGLIDSYNNATIKVQTINLQIVNKCITE